MAIQQEHAVSCDGYHQFSVRTGYDSVLPQRTTDLFAFTAKKPGVVREVSKLGIIVDYDDGEAQGFELGRRFGSAAGLTIAHNVITPLKADDKFVVGDPIVYNDGFFEPDFFDPRKIVLKNAMEVPTVMWESAGTHEDSSAISTTLSDKLSTKITKVKIVEVRFDQTVSNVVQVGQEVTADTSLCIVEDAVTANNKLFDESSIETLRALAAQSPRARVKGVVERIEVYYHGDREDMSESLQELSAISDRGFKKRASAAGKTGYTGKVDGGFRIEGNPLTVDTVAIKIYITSRVGCGLGDKGVFANQMKTVFGDVIEGEMTTESGQKIEAIFGCKSVEARIVNSPFAIGTTSTLLRVIAKKAIDIYRGRK